jgi:hypothetical protein
MFGIRIGPSAMESSMQANGRAHQPLKAEPSMAGAPSAAKQMPGRATRLNRLSKPIKLFLKENLNITKTP